MVSLFANLVGASGRVGAASARLAKVREMVTFLRTVPPDEIEIAIDYLSGEIPQGRIGIGYAVLQAVASHTAADTATLSIFEVDRRLAEIAATRGGGSAARRTASLRGLFSRATLAEQQFLVRLLTGEIRQGALAGIMVDVIASAADLPPAQVRRAAMYSKSLGAVGRAALLEGPHSLDRFQLELFSPVSPMLAQTAADVADAFDILGGEVAFEWKMDGARIQVHKSADQVRIYTRHLNDVTDAVPEIAEVVRTLPERTLVLDGEAIAVGATGRPLPFQTTLRRFGRKLNVDALRNELPMRAFFFDCLRFGVDTVVHLTAEERFGLLAQAVPEPLRIPRLVTASAPAASTFYDSALDAGHEGLMAKSLKAVYEAGSRGAAWLKIKRAHTLDLVVLAAEWGHGRRTGKLSNLHLGALEPASGEYVMLGKTFKGLNDAMLEWQTREFLAREVRRDQGTVYIRPEMVVEIAFSDLQASVRYPGGLALRLARVKRYRNDKNIGDADTMDSVRKIFADARAGDA